MDEKATSGEQMATDGGRCVFGFANEATTPAGGSVRSDRKRNQRGMAVALRMEHAMLCGWWTGVENRPAVRMVRTFRWRKEWHKMRQFHSLCHWVGVRSHVLADTKAHKYKWLFVATGVL